MLPFLKNVANVYYKKYGQGISRFTFVFSNKRAGLFFQKYISEIAKQPIFSPEILTVPDLFSKLSDYRLADRIEMLFVLYDLYKDVSKTIETFDEFIFWGEMLINDFDDVDKYLVDPKQIFQNIFDLKEIDAGFSYLTEEQINAIRRFWANFSPHIENSGRKDFLELWEVLYSLYISFKETLASKQQAYEGMIFRDVIDRTKSENFNVPFEKIIFVGLNAHSKSEEVLLQYLYNLGIADFYWDYASSLVKDPYNKSSYFIERNRSFKSEIGLDAEDIPIGNPLLEVTGIPSMIGQSKYVNTILKRLIKEGEMSIEEGALDTAVILPDENLLLPTLYSIPDEVKKINVTMGYNLHHSSVAGLMEHIFELQKNIRKANNQDAFYFRHVLQIINHRYITAILGESVDIIKKDIILFNKIIIPVNELRGHPLLKLIFTPIEEPQHISGYLKNILSYVNMSFVDRKQENKDEDLSFIDMESEFIVEYYKTINKMDEALKNAPSIEMTVSTYVTLLKRLISGINVPFSGEPLSGLQMMGVLETRSLDFKNIIILSMNEGVFPLKKTANSFVPYNLRKSFGLPTYEHQDSIYAYHFYRMICRARNIFLIYDTRTEGLQTGEVSRYFHQLKYLYFNSFDIKEQIATYKISTNAGISINMQKTPLIMDKLKNFLAGGEKSLSASAINMYLDCPLQFYFSVVEQLKEIDEVTERVEANTFGSIFHSVMEWIYEPFKGKLVTADLLQNIIKDDQLITDNMERSFALNFFKTENIKPLTGQNFLTGEVLRKYVKRVLKTDIKLTPFLYIGSEKSIKTDYILPSGKSVSLKGFLDRIDKVGEHIRIIDYKTGKGFLRFSDMKQLFDKELKDRPKAVMQVFMYALLYTEETTDAIVEPGIYYLRNLFDDRFDPCVMYKPTRFENVRVNNFSKYKNEFKDEFDKCLEEIFDQDISFAQTTNGKVCEWCAFTNICKK